ncbi:MAG: S26 family signal peptidase [Candidatus Sumerlaeaceae bacterium]
MLLLVLLWITVATDAFVTAIRINGETWSFRNSVAAWFAMVFYAGCLFTAFQFLLPFLFLSGTFFVLVVLSSVGRLRHKTVGWKTWAAIAGVALGLLVPVAGLRGSGRVFALVRVTKDLDFTELRAGDLLLVWYGAYWFRSPQLGEVVHFDPPRFVVEKPGTLSSETFVINIQDYFQRVCGVGGDTIQISPPLILRNGQLLSRSLYPFGADNLTVPFRFAIPERYYFLPVTVIPRDAFASLIAGEPPTLFQRGWIFRDWDKACLVPREAITGKVLSIADPPSRRRWF